MLKGDNAVALGVTLIVSLCLIAEAPTVLDYWFKAQTQAAAPALARTASTFLSVLAKCACLVLGLGVAALAWTVVFESLAAGIGLVLAYRWYAAGSRTNALSVDLRLVRPLLRECRPYLLSAVAVIAYMKIDIVLLGYLSSDAETGIYSLAQKLSEVLYSVPVALVDSAYPALARRFAEGTGNHPEHGQTLFDLAVGGATAATLVALALAGPFVVAVFGAGYERSVAVFHLHAWSCVAMAMAIARHRWMAVLGLQRYAPIVTLAGLLANVALNLALIPTLGATGAAIATLASYFLSGYLLSFVFAPLREIGRMQTRALWPWGRLCTGALLWQAARGSR
jgi:O-antigen/teichoic acid export membrane protein